VSEPLQLPFPLSYETALSVTNKAHMKVRMADCGIPTANYLLVDDTKHIVPRWPFPWVVKPVDCNSSKGVRKIVSHTEYEQAVKQAHEASRSGRVLVEEFKEGIELSVDAQVCENRAEIILITCSVKNRTKPSIFPIVQSRFPAGLVASEVTQISKITQSIARSFGLDNTFLLVQLIATKTGMFVVEFSARMGGGGKHRLISMVTQRDAIHEYVDSHFTAMRRLHPCWHGGAFTMNYVYTTPCIYNGIQGIHELKREGIVEQSFEYKTHGMEIYAADTSSDRVGAFLVVGAQWSEVDKKTQEADARLYVPNQVGADVMIHGLWRNV
jgi:phosphoribosylamine-glycine ligase